MKCKRDGAYVINLDEYSDIGIYWIALYALNNVTYFDSWKSWKRNSKFQAHDSVVCGYFCIGFIDFMLKGKG